MAAIRPASRAVSVVRTPFTRLSYSAVTGWRDGCFFVGHEAATAGHEGQRITSNGQQAVKACLLEIAVDRERISDARTLLESVAKPVQTNRTLARAG